MKPLEGKVALVTGASSGIGRATAVLLAENGCKAILTGRRHSHLETVAEEIRSKGGEAAPFTLDVSDEAQVRAVVEKARLVWNRLDILVNAAGIMHLNPVLNADTGEWRQMISVNLLGSMYLTHAVLPIMKY